MPILAAFCVFGLAFLSFILGYNYVFGARIRMNRRVEEVVGNAPVPVRQQELSVPLFQRLFKPALIHAADRIARFIPAARGTILAKRLTQAGNPGNLSPNELLVIKYLFAAGCTLGAYMLSQFMGKNAGQSLILTAAGLACGWMLPDIFINARIARRKDEVVRGLPDVLDLLTVSMEAGLGFDGAILKVVEKSNGVLADEFVLLLQEIKMGKPRRDALRDLSDRIGVGELSNFIGSVILADQLGISLGTVLRQQSRDMRVRRRQNAEEKAMKAPVKMLIPIVLFIFPAIFVILLGPAIIQMMNIFGGG